MEEVNKLLAERRFTGTRLRLNIAPESQRDVHVHPIKGTRLKVVKKAILSDMPKPDTPLWHAIANVAPESATWNAICVNKNIKYEKHVD